MQKSVAVCLIITIKIEFALNKNKTALFWAGNILETI